MGTRPDITYAVNQCARYSSDPKTDHWVAVMRILRYLNGTRDYGLFYHRHMSQYDGVNALSERVRTSNIKQPFAYSSAYFPGTTLANLQGYFDVDFANSVDDRRSITGYVFMFAPLGVVMFLSFRLDRIAASTAQMLFWAYAGLMGISLSMVFLIYTGASITKIFLISASLFGSMSLYGYTTQRDLTSMGSFLTMGLWGIILASLVNMFLKSGQMEMVISIISVLIFTGLTAYDTQTIKEIYVNSDDHEVATKKAVFGALQLYLDFINIFLSLLRLFGERR